MKIKLTKKVTGKDILKLKGARGDFKVTIRSLLDKKLTRTVGVMGSIPNWLLLKAIAVEQA
jgi:hypothetical protein